MGEGARALRERVLAKKKRKCASDPTKAAGLCKEGKRRKGVKGTNSSKKRAYEKNAISKRREINSKTHETKKKGYGERAVPLECSKLDLLHGARKKRK